jgi:pantoate kinase
VPYNNELYHYGVKGQKWHQRRYQNYDGSLTPAGKARYSSGSTITENIITENVITENVLTENVITEQQMEKMMAVSMSEAVKMAKDPKVQKLMLKTLKVAAKTTLKSMWSSVKKKAKSIKNKISGWLSKIF